MKSKNLLIFWDIPYFQAFIGDLHFVALQYNISLPPLSFFAPIAVNAAIMWNLNASILLVFILYDF